MSTKTRLLPFQPMSMTTAQLAAVSFLARYAGQTHELYSYHLRRWFEWCEGYGLDPLVGIQRAQVRSRGAHQVSRNVASMEPQQVGLGALEVLGQELGRVNTVVCGHRVVLLRRTLVGLLKDHAVAASHHDATLNNGPRRTPRPWTQLRSRQRMRVNSL
jgi:hypothetical protein